MGQSNWNRTGSSPMNDGIAPWYMSFIPAVVVAVIIMLIALFGSGTL